MKNLYKILVVTLIFAGIFVFLSVTILNKNKEILTTTQTVYTNTVSIKSGFILDNALLTRSTLVDPSYGLLGSGFSSVSLSNLTIENVRYGMKIGSGSQATGLTATGILARNVNQAIFAANLSNSTFTGLNFTSAISPFGTKNHVIYLERGNHNLTFNNVKLRGGFGQSLHLYSWEARSDPSDHITFNGLDIVNDYTSPIIISGGYDTVIIKNLKATAPSGVPVISFYGDAKNIVIDGFEAWGGSSLLGSGSPSEHAVNVTIKNGIYHGTKIDGSGGKIDNLTIENVGSGTITTILQTTTTVFSTTSTTTPQTTTLPPTTTTIPVTTTTAPPTTTTLPTTTTTLLPMNLNITSVSFKAIVNASKVSFYVDGILKRTDSNSPFTYTWTVVSGNHTITAIAYNSTGNEIARSSYYWSS